MYIPECCHVDAVLREYCAEKPFLHLVEREFGRGTPDTRKIRKAYFLAREVFSRKPRLNGDPYITHLIAVAVLVIVSAGVRDRNAVIAALLHDLSEDYSDNWPIDRVRRVFGPTVARYVAYVTNPSTQGQPSDERRWQEHAHLSRLRYAPPAPVVIKWADRFHNMRTMNGAERDRVLRKISDTHTDLIPVFEMRREIRGPLLRALRQALRLAKQERSTP